MKGADLKAFRKANNLTQTELGNYLGINKSFISTIESGKDPMPKDKLSKLLNNPFGWDVSMLKDNTLSGLDSVRPQREITPELIRSAVEKALSPDEKFLIGYLERKIENQDTLIRELYQKIGMLEAKLELARKGESVTVADGSLSADAV
jgi:transcriptional regulator with XRE-family HTH domain